MTGTNDLIAISKQAKESISLYLERFRIYYPGILEWYSTIESEIETGRRTVFVALDGVELQGLVITKNGQKAKLCHISVSPTARSRGIGSTLLGLALRNMVSRGAQEIRVTTSEEVFRTHGSFFRSAGFKELDWEVHRYRRDVSEILWKMDINPLSCGEKESVNYLRDPSGSTCALVTNSIPVGIFERPHNSVVTGVMQQSNRNSCDRFNVACCGDESLLGSNQSTPIYILYSSNRDQQFLAQCTFHENIKNREPTQPRHHWISDSERPVTAYKNAPMQICIMSYDVNWSFISASNSLARASISLPPILFKTKSK